jgi:hypothetical protein
MTTTHPTSGAVVEQAEDEDHPAYLLVGVPVRPGTRTGQESLRRAYLEQERPRCQCTAAGTPMYIAQVGTRFIVKRMPDTGSLHASHCGSYVPEDVSGLGHLLGEAIRFDPASGQSTLRLAFRLSVGERAAPDSNGSTPPADSVRTAGKQLSLRALLDYLWHESDLVAWSPAMTGRRHWGLIAWLLRQTAATTRAKGDQLIERLYVPEPFRLDHKAEIAARRLRCWQKAAARPGRVQQLMVLIAEAKAIEPARFGHRMILKHVPDAPLFLNEALHRRMSRRYARELDLWASDHDGHLIVIATFMVGPGGSATAEELALMPTTAQWLPYETPYTKVLLETLVDQRRRFRVTPRFTLPPGPELPNVVLTDLTEPTPLHLRDDPCEGTEPSPSVPWSWNVQGPMPPLPHPH